MISISSDLRFPIQLRLAILKSQIDNRKSKIPQETPKARSERKTP